MQKKSGFKASQALDFRAPPGAPSEEYAKCPPPPLGSSKSYDPRLVRAERYELLAAARGLLYTEGLRQKLLYPNHIHATTKCRYISRGSSVAVLKSKEHGKAFYGGLATCGSVWSCPVCSALIQERRRVELEHAVNWAHENNLQVVMVTLTFPHKSWHTMKELLVAQADALLRLRKGKQWDKYKLSIGYQGMIRGLETKYGKNGWHNHTHDLNFVSRDAIADLSTDELIEFEMKKRGCTRESLVGKRDMRSVYDKRWKSACIAAGIYDESKSESFAKHAVDVKGWCSASDYLAKQDDARNWGIDREMAKANNKTNSGGRKGLHPFGLLANAAEGDELAGHRFVEYSLTIRGKAQMYWCQGLKAKVGIKHKTDGVLAREDQDKASCLGLLERDDWQAVRSVPGAMSKVLDIAEVGGWAAVRAYVDALKKNAERNASAYTELRAEAKILANPRLPIPAKLGRGKRTPARMEDVAPLKPLAFDPGDSNFEFPF